jgi:hypothetical protein
MNGSPMYERNMVQVVKRIDEPAVVPENLEVFDY